MTRARPSGLANQLPRAQPKTQHILPAMWKEYRTDAELLARMLDFASYDLQASTEVMESNKGKLDIKTINWFIPDFDNVFWGGINTIFRFAEYFKRKKGVRNRIIAFGLGGVPAEAVSAKIRRGFPDLCDEVYTVISPKKLDEIPTADASVCTFWTTAYLLLKYNQTKRKFYFLQDFEPLFYPAGSTSAQVEATYRFGFYGITNTISLKETYEREYDGKAEYFTPCVDTSVFHPSLNPKERPFTVFFYVRPNHPRNCFELGAAALRDFKKWGGDKVRIVAAGSDWAPNDFGLQGTVEQLGLLQYLETATLYRECDAGLVFMVTRHPSYIPFELMASGCLVITNHNPYTTWLLKNEENCLLTELSATSISETLKRAYLERELRNRITERALATIRKSFANWDSQYEKVFAYMCTPV